MCKLLPVHSLDFLSPTPWCKAAAPWCWNGGVYGRVTACWSRKPKVDEDVRGAVSLFRQSDLLGLRFVNQQPPHFHYEDFCFFIQDLNTNSWVSCIWYEWLTWIVLNQTTYHSNIIKNTLRGAVRHHLQRKEKILNTNLQQNNETQKGTRLIT